MLNHRCFRFNAFQENTYVLWDDQRQGLIIDPGCYTYEERQELKKFLDDSQIQLQAILNTHAHIDHVLGVAYLQEQYGLPLYLHPQEEVIFQDVAARAEFYGFEHYQHGKIDHYLSDQQCLEFGGLKLKTLLVPGHAPGHVAFYLEHEATLFSGDVLFRRSVGRTDFPHCHHPDLVRSLQQVIYQLPGETLVLPGHGGSTRIEEEKIHNPFVKAL